MNPESAGTRIVQAGVDDLPRIAALAATVWRAHYPGIIPPSQIEYMLARMYTLDTLRAEIETGGVNYDCARIRGDLAGFSASSPASSAGEFKLHKLYVHPSHQRRGVGTLLLQHVERLAAARGAATLILAVNKANTNAIAAYRKNGFSVREAVVVDIGGGFVMDDFVMAKRIA